MQTIVLLVALVIVAVVKADEKCCTQCPADQEKYFSVPLAFKNNCGESCIAPADYDLYHKFEPELTKADSNTPCADRGFITYVDTETHSPRNNNNADVSIALDLYTNNNSTASLGAITPSLSAASECQVAGYLKNAGFPSSSIGTMVCIAKWESSFNCGATNHNNDGSTDYGLFEINSYYWCSGDAKSKYDECNTSCSSLMDCQKNTNCAYKVYKEQGYNAWYGYKAHQSECDSYAAPSC